MAGLSYADLLKYGLPVAGNLVGGLIQAKASSNASDAQQKYLEEALAYEKEKDTYQRGIDAAAVTKEANRYGDYQGRIAPFIANGMNSNARMAALLGLPAASGGGGGYGGGSSGPPASQGVPVTPELTAKLTNYYKSLGLTPTEPGTGPTDIAYMAQQYAATGGSNPGNDAYWLDTGPNGRITQELDKAGVKYGQPSAAAPPTAAPAPAQQTTQPQARTTDAMVTLRAPDGSTKQVPQSQAAFYQSKGATVLQGAA
jgi:hypothetical protein